MNVFIDVVLGTLTILMGIVPSIFERRKWSKRNICMAIIGIITICFIIWKAIGDKNEKDNNDKEKTTLNNIVKDIPRKMDSLSAHRDQVDSINLSKLIKSSKEHGFNIKNYELVPITFTYVNNYQHVTSNNQKDGQTAGTINNNYHK